MPIRFRCVYCEQLLGIARRKAGSTVRCTKCQRELVVPHEQPAGAAPLPPTWFERDDLGDLLKFDFDAKEPALTPPEGQPAAVVAPAPPGYVVSRRQAMIVAGVVVLVVGLAFALGVVVGRHG